MARQMCVFVVCSCMLVGRMGDDQGGSEVGEKYNVHAFVFNSTYSAPGGKAIECKQNFLHKETFCESF